MSIFAVVFLLSGLMDRINDYFCKSCSTCNGGGTCSCAGEKESPFSRYPIFPNLRLADALTRGQQLLGSRYQLFKHAQTLLKGGCELCRSIWPDRLAPGYCCVRCLTFCLFDGKGTGSHLFLIESALNGRHREQNASKKI